MGRLLFIDKVLMSDDGQPARGVELFNIRLVQDLAAQGWRVTVAAHVSWKDALQLVPSPIRERIEVVSVQKRLGAWRRAALLCRHRYSAVILGNVANRLIPVMLWLRMRRVAPLCVLIAHREPSRRCLWAQKLWRSVIVAVNRQIAGHFERFGFSVVAVYYGIIGAERFFPQPEERGSRDELVHFCVAGQLDNAWKGSDTAVEAFRLLPDSVKQRCRLHLASFSSPPDFGDDRILAYDWMDASAMPEFFRRMSVMIVPSRDESVMRETFSQVMVQGMLSGLPILASRLPILEEKLDQGGGVVFDDPVSLRDAMVRFVELGDRERKSMGITARSVALERYVWNTREFAERFLPGKH